MIDLHSHILPGVDDGASTLEDSLALCRAAAADGCQAIVATPHLRHERFWNDDRAGLEQRWRELRDATQGLIEVHLGSEIAVNSASSRELEELPHGGLLPLAGSRYVLLEFHPRMSLDPEDLLHELTVEGWIPILAHPERIPWMATDLDYLADLVDIGALVQLTAMSVSGDLGRQLFEISESMLAADLVHFVASDAHHVDWRPPGLSKAYQQIVAKHDEATARRLCVENPRAVIENRQLGSSAIASQPTIGAAERWPTST